MAASPDSFPRAPFSNASLNGQYVYQIEGFDFSNPNNVVPYREAGVFTANGNKLITSATDDFSEGTGIFTTVSTGSYGINSDGTGSITFNNALLGPITLEVTMVSASKVYLVEADSAVNAGGIAEMQNSTAITAVPNGTFVFREHDINFNTAAILGQRGRIHAHGRRRQQREQGRQCGRNPQFPNFHRFA